MNDVSNLTLEELMELVNKDGSSASTLNDDNSNVKHFIRELGLHDGNVLVPNFVVYEHYRRVWRPKGKKLGKIDFLRKMAKVFETARKKHTRYFKLNKGVFDTSEEGIKNAKEHDIRYRRKQEKKKEQKKLDKISRLEKAVQPEVAE